MRGLPAYAKTLVLILSLGLVEWLTMARIVRGQVLVLKNQQFVTAARSLGQTHAKILTRHLLPNLTGIIAVYLTLTIPAVILDESFLSYLGLGVDASQASWGTLLSDGAQAVNPIKSSWWLLIFSGGDHVGDIAGAQFPWATGCATPLIRDQNKLSANHRIFE